MLSTAGTVAICFPISLKSDRASHHPTYGRMGACPRLACSFQAVLPRGSDAVRGSVRVCVAPILIGHRAESMLNTLPGQAGIWAP